MTKNEALKKMQAVKSYITSGNPIWDTAEIAEAFDMAIEALEQLEWKKGKWLLSAQRDGFEGSKCSQCGYHIFNTPLYGHNYCPNCGADMRGGERGEEE